MQAASAVQVTVRRFGVWNALLGMISGTTLAVAMAWLVMHHDDPLDGIGMALIFSLLLGLLGTIALVRRQPIVLRWDTQHWQVNDPSRGAVEIELLGLSVVLDLGSWMLLKLHADLPSYHLRNRWIPVQRRGMETHWHSLRCALYAHDTVSILANAIDRQAPRG
jgi:hypothetical protein